jgi:hypothetical protein
MKAQDLTPKKPVATTPTKSLENILKTEFIHWAHSAVWAKTNEAQIDLLAIQKDKKVMFFSIGDRLKDKYQFAITYNDELDFKVL